MPKKSPLEVVNETFGGKDKLVDKLVGLLESDESKDELRKRLLAVANSKLLRLHGIASVVREKFGSREKLVEQTATFSNRPKDKDFRTRLDAYSTARLVDIARVAERRNKAAATAAAAPAKPKAAKKTKAAGKAPSKSGTKAG